MPRHAASPAPAPNSLSLELAFTAANALALVAWSSLVARTHVANNARPNNRDELPTNSQIIPSFGTIGLMYGRLTP